MRKKKRTFGRAGMFILCAVFALDLRPGEEASLSLVATNHPP